ncbi:MAG: hypothetical protein ACLVJH_04480 [Faecalibacterium prausnitzii]
MPTVEEYCARCCLRTACAGPGGPDRFLRAGARRQKELDAKRRTIGDLNLDELCDRAPAGLPPPA